MAWASGATLRPAARRALAGPELPTDDVASLAWGHATLIRMTATSFDPAEAVGAAPRALALAQAAELEEAAIDVSISIGLARGHRGER